LLERVKRATNEMEERKRAKEIWNKRIKDGRKQTIIGKQRRRAKSW